MKFATFDNDDFPTAFYAPEIHGDNIPADATEITEEQWAEFINNNGLRKWVNGSVVPYDPPTTPVSPFLPIDPVPFWNAALDLLGLKKSDVLDPITDPDERYLAELAIEGRKTYVRDDPMVIQLATLKGYSSASMDQLWLFVQENYS